MNTEWVRIVDCTYQTETTGYRYETPVIHLFVRDENWNRHHILIDTFEPYFLVRESEWHDVGDSFAADDRVQRIETTDRRGRAEQALDREQLFRVVCTVPGDVADLREMVDNPMEADVLFPQRFLIDMATTQWIQISTKSLHTTGMVSTDDITIPSSGTDETVPDTVPPLRHCIYDIEVQQSREGPAVVSETGTENASNPITAISAYDSYTMEYHLWILTHTDWTQTDIEAVQSVAETVDVPVKTHIYERSQDVVSGFCNFIDNRRFDSLIGWNAGSFDHPYLINYGLQHVYQDIQQLAPAGTVHQMNGDGRWGSLDGRMLLDLMDLYEQTKVHELDSKRLQAVAESEGIAVGKLDITETIDVPDDAVSAIDYAHQEHPTVFVEYSLRDTQACVGIITESQRNVSIV